MPNEPNKCPNCHGPDLHLDEFECIRSLADRLFNAMLYIDHLKARLEAVEETL